MLLPPPQIYTNKTMNNDTEQFRSILRTKTDAELLELLRKAARDGLCQRECIIPNTISLREKMKYMIELLLEMFHNHNEMDNQYRHQQVERSIQNYTEFCNLLSPHTAEQRRENTTSPTQSTALISALQHMPAPQNNGVSVSGGGVSLGGGGRNSGGVSLGGGGRNRDTVPSSPTSSAITAPESPPPTTRKRGRPTRDTVPESSPNSTRKRGRPPRPYVEYNLGQKIKCCWWNNRKHGNFAPGKIVTINDNGTFNIDYDDDVKVKNVNSKYIREN